MTDKETHGAAPDKSRTALLLIDVINDLRFPEAGKLIQFAIPMARRIRGLKASARRAGVPAIYVNDNFGRWRSDFDAIVAYCLKSRGKDVARLLRPTKQDYVVLKPRHSGFYSTTLETLLGYLGVRRLIITGMAANICVLFTANDAYMRGFRLWVPSDCVCSNTTAENDFALTQMSTVLKADIRPFEGARNHRFVKRSD